MSSATQKKPARNLWSQTQSLEIENTSRTQDTRPGEFGHLHGLLRAAQERKASPEFPVDRAGDLFDSSTRPDLAEQAQNFGTAQSVDKNDWATQENPLPTRNPFADALANTGANGAKDQAQQPDATKTGEAPLGQSSAKENLPATPTQAQLLAEMEKAAAQFTSVELQKVQAELRQEQLKAQKATVKLPDSDLRTAAITDTPDSSAGTGPILFYKQLAKTAQLLLARRENLAQLTTQMAQEKKAKRKRASGAGQMESKAVAQTREAQDHLNDNEGSGNGRE
jgi:hypothetical protein